MINATICAMRQRRAMANLAQSMAHAALWHGYAMGVADRGANRAPYLQRRDEYDMAARVSWAQAWAYAGVTGALRQAETQTQRSPK